MTGFFWLLAAFFIGYLILKQLFLFSVGVIISGIVGTLADKVVPGKLPLGIFGAIMAGWLGFILGHKLLGTFGPSVAGISLLPAFLGAVVVAFAVELLGSKRS